MPRPPRPSLVLLALLAAVPLAGCGGDAGGASPDGPVVVATTTQLTDLARNVAGSRAEVRGLLAANADPHDHEVRPSDVEALAGAEVVLRSGGDLDEWLGEAIASAGAGAEPVDVGRAARPLGDDPHWWQDPRNAVLAVGRIRDALAAADPAGAARYRANAARYVARLRRLDAAIARCIGRIPAARRKLVTTHDALGQYARRYGLEVTGAVIPSRSTRGQASAGETAALVATIRREGVRAIFAESSVDPKVESAIARESGARVGDALYADTLGPEGSDGATYAGSMAANTRAIVEGLTGGARTCSPS